MTDPKSADDEWEASVDAAIEACEGDLRATIKVLLVANAFLEDQLASAVPAVSYGYSKGRYAKA